MMCPLEGRPGRQSSSEAEGFCANKSPYFTFWAFEEVWLKTFIYKFICRISFHSCCLPVSCTVDSYFLVKYRYWIGRDMKSYENKRTNDSREEHTIVECIYFKLWAYWLGIIWNFRFKFSWVQCSHWTFFLVAFTPKAPKKSCLCQIITLEMKLFFVIELHCWCFQFLSSLASNTLTSYHTTSSDKEFQGFTALTAKLFLLMFSHDGCVLNFIMSFLDCAADLRSHF